MNTLNTPIQTFSQSQGIKAVEEGVSESIEGIANQPSSLVQECFEVQNDGSIRVLSPKQGGRLAGHFPNKTLIPGVASTMLMSRFIGPHDLDISTREFLKPISPGDRIRVIVDKYDSTVTIVDADNPEDIRAICTGREHAITQYPLTTDTLFENIKDGIESKGLIPHGENFHFVDYTWLSKPTSSTEENTEVNNKIIHGLYTIRKGDMENGVVPWWLLEESAAQMMLGGYRFATWNKDGRPEPGDNDSLIGNGEIMTYKRAETKVFDHNKITHLIPQDELVLMGQFLKRDKSSIEGEYGIYTLDVSGKGKLLFSGRITGTLMSLRAWKKFGF